MPERLTILLVDDENALLRLCMRVLENVGYNVLSASTPFEAILIAETYNGHIHLLLTDVRMPDMNGKELSDKLSSIRQNMLTLFMSGYSAEILSADGINAEVSNFIHKPFSLKALIGTVEIMLKNNPYKRLI
jgi:two-component system cell cycle sensor histidine kinase/response regulator CckA